MNIALIAFDLDGTTIVQHKYLPQANRLALEEAARQGAVLVPASGRMKDFLPGEITSLPGVRYAITANGAGVYDLETGKAVWKCLVSNEKARQVQKLLDEYDLFEEYYSQGRAITRRGDRERAVSHFGMPQESGTESSQAEATATPSPAAESSELSSDSSQVAQEEPAQTEGTQTPSVETEAAGEVLPEEAYPVD